MLIPGVGAQGGSLEDAVHYGVDSNRQSALINVSRTLIYPAAPDAGSFSSIDDYERAVAVEALKIHDGMMRVL